MRNMGHAYKTLVGKMKENDHLGNIGIHGRVTLRWILRK
jgi:hypothetical protein